MDLDRPEAPADTIGLLIGAEANRERSRSARSSPRENMHRQLSPLRTEQCDSSDPASPPQDSHAEDAEPSADFLGRVGSYNRLMAAHTKSQLDSPGTGTIPTYTKTMHAHTLHQLTDHRRLSKSEASSPHPIAGQAMLPGKISGELTTLASGAQPPLNTPDQTARKVEPVLLGIDFGKLRTRSLTTPYAARDFAAVEATDFAPAAVGEG